MTDLVSFLEEYVEGFLFHDLQSMEDVTLEEGEKYGGCGYSMLGSMLAGMELLGALVSSKTFKKKRGSFNFLGYWKHYLCRCDQRYNVPVLDELMHELVRNGIAHTFLAKPGVFVSKGKPAGHLARDPERGQIVVDAAVLFHDFRDSYFRLVKPIALGQSIWKRTTAETMRLRLKEITDQYNADSYTLFRRLFPEPRVEDDQSAAKCDQIFDQILGNTAASTPAMSMSTFARTRPHHLYGIQTTQNEGPVE